MRGSRWLAAVGFVAIGLPALAVADVQLEVASEAGARVQLDGEAVGEAPLTLSGLAPGDHRLDIEDPTTGAVKTFMVHSPRNATVARRIDASFAAAPAPVYLQQPAPVYAVAQPAPVYRDPYRDERERRNVRTRNALLGATLASQVLIRNGHERQHWRNTGLGLTLLHELFH